MAYYGIGIKDIRCHGAYERRVFQLWVNMLSRCYSGESRYRSYADWEVCEDWKTFSKFLEDVKNIRGYEYWRDNPGKRISLDKDINFAGVKEYNLENCAFVSLAQNTKEMIDRNPQAKGNFPKPRAVICTDEDGCSTVYPSMLSAEKDGFRREGIWAACHGIIKKYKKCSFEYA